MGADIHFYIETKKDKKAAWTSDTFHKVEITTYDDDEQEWSLEDIHVAPGEYNRYVGRNYRMFSILADVRGNDGIIPRRGIPKGVSKNVKRKIDSYGSDGHSHTYMSLDEFKLCLDTHNTLHKYIPDDYERVYQLASNWLMNEQAEAKLLETGLDPQLRFVMFFDN